MAYGLLKSTNLVYFKVDFEYEQVPTMLMEESASVVMNTGRYFNCNIH